MNYETRDTLIAVSASAIVLALVVMFLVVMTAIGNRMSFPAKVAGIERLRADASEIDAVQAEDVIGQVTAMNQVIVQRQTCNRLWWCDVLQTDAWNGVALIPVPRRGARR